jgi:hypothetical protein
VSFRCRLGRDDNPLVGRAGEIAELRLLAELGLCAEQWGWLGEAVRAARVRGADGRAVFRGPLARSARRLDAVRTRMLLDVAGAHERKTNRE